MSVNNINRLQEIKDTFAFGYNLTPKDIEDIFKTINELEEKIKENLIICIDITKKERHNVAKRCIEIAEYNRCDAINAFGDSICCGVDIADAIRKEFGLEE